MALQSGYGGSKWGVFKVGSEILHFICPSDRNMVQIDWPEYFMTKNKGYLAWFGPVDHVFSIC